MLHFVTSYMKQNKSRKPTLKGAQNGLEIIFKPHGITGYNSNSTDKKVASSAFNPKTAQ